MKVFASGFVAIFVSMLSLHAQDVLIMNDDTRRSGAVTEVNDQSFRLKIPPPLPGQPSATISVERSKVKQVIFEKPSELDALSKDLSVAHTAAARLLWNRQEAVLAIPESYAGEAGIVYIKTLLLSSDRRRFEEAFEIAQRIEKDAWSDSVRSEAKRERLRAMLKLGRVEEAAKEAQVLAESSEDSEFLLDTKLLLAQTQIAELRKLLEDNPRWQEDPPVREQRRQFINVGLELALFPFLFHGTAHEKAAEGLWLAHEIYLLSENPNAAKEVATDIVTIYPQTRLASAAREALKDSPEEDKSQKSPTEL